MKISINNKGIEFIKSKTIDFDGNASDVECINLPIGSIIDDLYNLDFNSFEDFNSFLSRYGIYSVHSLCKSKLDSLSFKDDIEAINYLYYDTDCVKSLRKLQEDFKPFIENIFIADDIIDDTNRDALTTFLTDSGLETALNNYADGFNITHERPHSGADFYIETYEHDNISGIVFVEFKEMLKLNSFMKQCRNCGRFFTVSGRSDTEYCSVPNKNGTSCRVAAYNKTAHQRLKDDEVSMAYKRASMLKYHWYKKGVVSKVDLDLWREQAKQHMKGVRAGQMKLEDFITWLKQ
ncbi:DUF6076 domain-containing protein [Ruminiclostridium cellobioparum]|uniref:DUF6076 domain-containing protein n=1 Tax=Ruminiclostridium cellobioparum TaxID=29355 RepID=UPI0028B013D1|nr:DUF6076 domain-containing protein [Ruminiclostridium cellobioparum]